MLLLWYFNNLNHCNKGSEKSCQQCCVNINRVKIDLESSVNTVSLLLMMYIIRRERYWLETD